MGSLLAGVAHELNNPLSIVVGRATMLQEETTDEGTRNVADKIRAAAERLCARIVRTFLAMARQRKLEKDAVEINTVLDDCVEMLGYGLRTAGSRWRAQLAEGLPPISANADQLHQVSPEPDRQRAAGTGESAAAAAVCASPALIVRAIMHACSLPTIAIRN